MFKNQNSGLVASPTAQLMSDPFGTWPCLSTLQGSCPLVALLLNVGHLPPCQRRPSQCYLLWTQKRVDPECPRQAGQALSVYSPAKAVGSVAVSSHWPTSSSGSESKLWKSFAKGPRAFSLQLQSSTFLSHQMGNTRSGKVKAELWLTRVLVVPSVRATEFKISFLYAKFPLTNACVHPCGPDILSPKTSLTCYSVFSQDECKYCICPQ